MLEESLNSNRPAVLTLVRRHNIDNGANALVQGPLDELRRRNLNACLIEEAQGFITDAWWGSSGGSCRKAAGL